jgi:hypothetical protein
MHAGGRSTDRHCVWAWSLQTEGPRFDTVRFSWRTWQGRQRFAIGRGLWPSDIEHPGRHVRKVLYTAIRDTGMGEQFPDQSHILAEAYIRHH